MNHTTRLLAQSAAASFLLLSALALTAHGQQSGGVLVTGPGERERQRQAREAMEREQLDQEREMLMLMTEKLRESAPPPRREPRLAFTQIREDYVRIQVVNNELAQAVASAGPLDLKLVSQSTAEIRKRADRLMLNLALPDSDETDARPKTTVGTEPAQLKSALGSLDEMILKLVRNPLFRNPKLVDAQQSPLVRRDLKEIIELSGQLKKRSEQLNKVAQKSQ
ncbi:MAG TPA: hypothetical protein VF544_01540 [Pyrinomonadaceae bacterium]|jgi:hypothetical protein